MNDEVDELAKKLWEYNLMHNELEPSDAIVALGSMDLRVAKRAAELWKQKLAPIIVVSGGYGRLTGKDWSEPEAIKFKRAILEEGVPEPAILLEDKSTNAAENFQYSLTLLKEKGLPHQKLIIVTKPYMERRAYATVKKLYPDLKIIMTSPIISLENYPTKEIPKDLVINIMVGDTQRIKLYPQKGFTIPQDIPPEVENAMDELIRLGYDEQLLKES
jgi:uncharacterized SAM-binding protein YcdF (DUF218 family)